MSTTPIHTPATEKYMIAFVIQGDDIFRVTADNIIHTCTGPNDGAFDGVAKLKAAAALMELIHTHRERPTELRRMARELAAEGISLLARSEAAPRLPVQTTAEMQAESIVA